MEGKMYCKVSVNYFFPILILCYVTWVFLAKYRFMLPEIHHKTLHCSSLDVNEALNTPLMYQIEYFS